jgi:hypothetical protein
MMRMFDIGFKITEFAVQVQIRFEPDWGAKVLTKLFYGYRFVRGPRANPDQNENLTVLPGVQYAGLDRR